jgi:hypothetical protein
VDRSVVGPTNSNLHHLWSEKKREKGKGGDNGYFPSFGWMVKEEREGGWRELPFLGAHFNLLPILGGK